MSEVLTENGGLRTIADIDFQIDRFVNVGNTTLPTSKEAEQIMFSEKLFVQNALNIGQSYMTAPETQQVF